MLSHEFSHVPSLPHHTHVIERAKRAKATLGGAEASEASQVGVASEASEPTCIYTLYNELWVGWTGDIGLASSTTPINPTPTCQCIVQARVYLQLWPAEVKGQLHA